METPYTILKTVAEEMESAAKQHVVRPKEMLEKAALGIFPDELMRIVILDGVTWRFQFSHDQIKEGVYFRHLSFGRSDSAEPTKEFQQLIKEVFFGDSEVVPFPSIWGGSVVHLMSPVTK